MNDRSSAEEVGLRDTRCVRSPSDRGLDVMFRPETLEPSSTVVVESVIGAARAPAPRPIAKPATIDRWFGGWLRCSPGI